MTAVFGTPAGFRNATPAEVGWHRSPRLSGHSPKTERHCESKEEKERRMWRCGRDAVR